jgi:hypothetical protein
MLLQFMQSLPSRAYLRADLELLLAEAYVFLNNYPLAPEAY